MDFSLQAGLSNVMIFSTTDGLVSSTNSEIAALSQTCEAGDSTDACAVLKNLLQTADKNLSLPPQPVKTLVTSGAAVTSGSSANTGKASKQADASYSLALSYRVSGETKYLTRAKDYLLAWAKTNKPVGDPIANAALIPLFKTYDLVEKKLSANEKKTASDWLTAIAKAVVAEQENALKKNSMSSRNNHQSFALLEVGMIGVALNNTGFTNYLTDNFTRHIGINLKSFPEEPPHLGEDYHDRKAIHYVAFNMQALGEAAILMDRLAHLSGNPYGIGYNPYTVTVNGASVKNTMKALLPYATGKLKSTNEFQGSLDEDDAARLANGSLSRVFQPRIALPALKAADYFAPAIGNTKFANVAAKILQDEGKLKLPASLPDLSFLLNDLRRQTSTKGTEP